MARPYPPVTMNSASTFQRQRKELTDGLRREAAIRSTIRSGHGSITRIGLGHHTRSSVSIAKVSESSIRPVSLCSPNEYPIKTINRTEGKARRSLGRHCLMWCHDARAAACGTPSTWSNCPVLWAPEWRLRQTVGKQSDCWQFHVVEDRDAAEDQCRLPNCHYWSWKQSMALNDWTHGTAPMA